MFPAARVGDAHVCLLHGGGVILPPGEPTVLIGLLPAARMGDAVACVGPPNEIAIGEPTVLIGNQPAARLTGETVHGGTIAMGCPTVLIGSEAQAVPLQRAAASGAPFCEVCEKARAAHEGTRA